MRRRGILCAVRSRAALVALVLAAFVFVAIPAATRSAEAQPPPEEYRDIIASAVDEFSEGRWAEASVLFERAHALYPNARTLRGMGMCAFEMRQYPDAIRFLERSLREARRELTSEQRTETQDLLRRAREFVGTFQLLTEPPGADLRVDDAVPRRGPEGHVVLSVGEHTLSVSALEHHPLERRLTVHGSEDETIRLALVPIGFGAPPAASLGLLVAGAATLLLEPFLIGWWVDRESEINACNDPPDGFVCRNSARLTQQRDFAIGTSVAVGVGALGIATAGLILWLVSDPEQAPEPLACGAQGVGLACTF